MKKFKKLILGAVTAAAAAVMSLCAVPEGVLPSLSFVASAATELPAAVEGVITLTEDTTIESWYSGDYSASGFTFDLNGHTLTVDNPENGHAFQIAYGNVVTVKNGTLNVASHGYNMPIWINYGTLILDNAAVTAISEYPNTFHGIRANSNTTLTIKNDSKITNTTFGMAQSATVTIDSSTLSGCTISNATVTNSTITNSTISGSKITGGTITGSTIKENSTVDNTAVIKSTTVTNSTVGGEQVTNDTYDADGNTGFTVTFDLNGATGSIDSQTISSGGKATAPTAPTREGYTFKGWYNNEACTGDPFNFDNTTITGNTTLYAKWLKHITYIDANGEEQTVGDDEDYTPVTSSTTSWSGTMVVADDVTIGADNSPIMVNGDTNLIICEGKTLTLNRRIHLRDNNNTPHTLTLNGTGSLVVSVNDASGCFTGHSGSLIINNCNVTLTQNNLSSPAIYETFDIILNSGNLSASNPSVSSSKAIDSATITLNGGTLIASSYRYNATIIVGTGKYYMDTTTGTLYTPDTYTTYTEGNNYIGNIDGHTLTPVYAITVADTSHGYVTASPAAFAVSDYEAANKTVTLTVPPDTGYQLNTLTVTGNTSGGTVPVSGTGDTRTFTMPAENVTVSAEFGQIPVSYIDADGETKSCTEYTLVTSETTSWSGTMVVADNVTINGKVTLSGDTNLILCDGAELTVTKDNGTVINGDNHTLNIFGQSGQPGKLKAINNDTENYTGISVKTLNVYGGDNEAKAGNIGIYTKDTVNIVRGTVKATAHNRAIETKNINISGGKVTATATGTNSRTLKAQYITLGWTKPTDSISITGVSSFDTGKFADNKCFTDGTGAIYSGTLTSGEISAIAGKTLVPAYKVTFDVNYDGGENIIKGVLASTGAITAPTAPTREGYTFGGWYTTAACTTAFDFANTVITEDTTIYAKWGKTLTANNVTVADLTYNGEEQTTVVKCGDVTLTAGTDYTVTYSPATVKNAGTYTANITGIGNYAGTVEKTFTVKKASITPTLIIQNKTYDGNEITYTITGNPGGDTVTNLLWSKQISDDTWSSGFSDTPKDAGKYRGQATIAETDNNFGATTNTVEFTISKAAITPTVSIANWVYGTTASTPSVTGNPGNGAVTYTYSSDGTTFSADVPTAVGSYTIKAVVAESANYLVGEATSTFSITKAPASCTAPAANSLTYTGSAQALVTEGRTNDGTMRYSSDGTSWSTNVPTGVNAGSYTVYYKVIGDANHSDSAARSVYVTIARAASSVATAPAANAPTYTGSAQALVTAGTANGGTMHYSLYGTSWSKTIPTGTDAGSYTVYYKVIGDANHSDTTAQSVDVVIAKAASSCTAPTANSLTYTGSALALVTAGTANGGTMHYNLDGTSWNAAIPTATNAGNYTVYYKVVGDGNHKDSESQSVDVTVGKASDKPLENVTDTLLRSAKSISISVASAVPADAGTVSGYAVNGTASTTGAVTVSNAAVSAAGLVTATLSGGAANDTITVPVKITAQNYDCTINVIVTLTELADPVFTAPTAKTLTYNGTAQELVTAGTVTTGGAMQYSTDGASWSTTVPTATNAGSYTVYYKIDETDEVNGVEAVPVNVSIARKAAVVTADNKTRAVAAPDPELTATVTGLVGSDTVNYTLSREAGEKVGIYTITPSGDAVQGNYTVTYQPGTLTIADVYVDGKPVDSTFTDILKNAVGDTVTITLGKDVSIEKLTFPKANDCKEIIIDGNGYTIGFTGSAAIKPNQKLTLVNVEITAEKNDKPQNITITAAKGGLTLEKVTLNGKKATVTASSGDLTLGNVTGNELTVKGAAKTTLTVNGDVDATTVSGFGTVNVNGTLNVTKTLTVNELMFADNAVLKVAGGADVTVKKGISGNGTLHIAEGFKPITLNGDITGNIKLVSDKPMADGTLLFKSKLTDLNEHFDISGIAPAVTDGEYGLYAKSGKVYLRAFRMKVGDTTYCEWNDIMSAITKAKASGKIYAIELLGNIDLGKTFKLPTKGKYAGLTINGNGHTITFSGRTITLTGDLTLTDLTLNATATKGCTIKQGKFKLDAGGAKLVNCTAK